MTTTSEPRNGVPDMVGDLDDPKVRTIINYQAAVAQGDLDAARAVFWPDVVYVVPGRSQLAGTYEGADQVIGYLSQLMQLTDGTYGISRMSWTTNQDSVALATVNSATRADRSLTWTEVIVFTFVEGRKKRIELTSGDQYGVDALFA